MAIDYSELPVEEAVRAARASSRRRQVLDAAVKVMGKTGFHQMSMQDLAAEAKVSVGLIYKYFGGKEDLLLATIVRILDVFRDQLAPVMDAAGDDVVDQLAAGIRRYIEIVDENLDGVVLTYRESRTLGPPGRTQIKELEIATAAPLRAAIEAGIAQGVFRRRRCRPHCFRHHAVRPRLGAQAVALRADLLHRRIHRVADPPPAQLVGLPKTVARITHT